jgi:restriction endonuclease Mrr
VYERLRLNEEKKREEKLEEERLAQLRSDQAEATRLENEKVMEEVRENYVRWEKLKKETEARANWREFYESKSMDAIASMSGIEFERWLSILFTKLGYQTTLTPINDQGGDLLCEAEGIRVVVQSKRNKAAVGNRAVQELLGAMLYYGCQRGMIVTNSTFTVAASSLAEKDPRISLHGGDWLRSQVLKLYPPEIPEFDWDTYDNTVRAKIR